MSRLRPADDWFALRHVKGGLAGTVGATPDVDALPFIFASAILDGWSTILFGWSGRVQWVTISESCE